MKTARRDDEAQAVEHGALAGRQLRVGLSDPVSGVSRLNSAIATAVERVQNASGTEPVVVSTALHVQSHRALLRMLGESTRSGYAREVLAPLLSYDERHNADLVGTLRALAFTVDRRGPAYAGRLAEAEVVETLSTAVGHWGSCAEYLLNTVENLEQRGIHDRMLWRLQARVAERIEDACRRNFPVSQPTLATLASESRA